ncbi:hypothetical protein [Streptomyces coeruleofuscus]|uniref:GNAT family N-acetyltransferase n=1 Tax=Streptomyces coeruleofuscus TaxID=66879 RepID=A0ABN3IVK8_9ACTN
MPRALPRHTPTLRVPPARFLEELRAFAADARLPLRTYTDEDGWEGE